MIQPLTVDRQSNDVKSTEMAFREYQFTYHV